MVITMEQRWGSFAPILLLLSPGRNANRLFLIVRNDCPHPLVGGEGDDDLTPVPPVPHFSQPRKMDELSGLVMNIVLPSTPPTNGRKYPVFQYVHGGSLLYGGANLPIFDAVNLVSQSLAINRPVVCVNFNYRVGFGGFLASKAIEEELRADGYSGCGNFGFTDQKVAFDWVQKYIGYLGGDANHVTAVGESAGGISISNQVCILSETETQDKMEVNS